MSEPLTLDGIELTKIGLGTNRLTDRPENRELLKTAVDAGLNFIDTANGYTNGESERTIGGALAPVRENVVVATKGGYRDGRPDAISTQIEESLQRLQTDTIPLYYLHRVDPDVPLEASLGAIREHRDQGTIRHVGISNVGVEEIERARQVVPVSAVQNHYSRTERGHDEVVDYCTQQKIIFVPYFPLRGHDGATLTRIAREHEATPAQIALAWLLRRSPIMLPIPGTTSIEHLRENLGALDVELTDAEYEELDERRA
jgi:pyridoxine 4-dehydrogenase